MTSNALVIFALGLDILFKSIHLMYLKMKLSLYLYHLCNFFILSFYPHTFEKYKFNFSKFLFICRFDAKGHEASQSSRQVPALQKFKINISEYILYLTEFDEIEYLPISKSMYPFRMRKSRIIFAAGGLTSAVVISLMSSLTGTSSKPSTSPSLLEGLKDLGSSKSKTYSVLADIS